MLFAHTTNSYVWAHNLVTVHCSDDLTDNPALFELWKPVELAALEVALRAAGIPLKAGKAALKESAPARWCSYVVGVWERRQKKHPELSTFYESKLSIARRLLQSWVTEYPDLKLPVVFDNWYTQPDFCRCLA